MKTLVISSLLISLLSSPFIEKAISNFNDKSFFIPVRLKCNNLTKDFVIENDDLYWFLKKSKGFNKEKYASFMKNTLAKDKVIKVDHVDSYFKEVKTNELISENAKKGLDYFVKVYFDEYGVLKNDIPIEERTAVIKKMFELEALCLVDDETGYIYIDRD